MKKTNIVLIGMPGAGKSTLGVILAKAVKMPFIDTDLLIQQTENRLLQQIVDDDGIKGFLEIEERVILGLEAAGHVIATGGSAVYSDAAMRQLKSRGFIVYLKLDYKDIEKRISNITTRGIVMDKGQELYDIFSERAPLYERFADIIVECSGRHIEELTAEIKSYIMGILK